MSDHTTVIVRELPPCNFCQDHGETGPARYDGRTIFGPWAYMCQRHFDTYGVGLGLGKGQRLVLEDEEES
ncbi:MAG TPA: hypothetical protein VFT74_17320 [Isosphaeraceae bacterium]|nr:hypothetical protein [Isosphaeraceae bacterium]